MIRASAPYTSGWGSFVLLKMDCIRVAQGGSLSTLHREEDETRDDYAVRVMQAVTQHQINSFNQMIQSMRDISKEVKKKKKPEWEETNEDEDSDNSNYQDAVEKPKI